MYVQARRAEILEAVRRTGQVSVQELSERYNVSAETIRRDLDYLAEDGQLLRVHGGALRHDSTVEPTLAERLTRNAERKHAIAVAARDRLCRDAHSIFLDAGTSTAALADELPDRADLLVVTNSLPIASSLATRTKLTQVRLIGGEVRGATLAAVGAEATAAILAVHPDLTFVGCNGMTPESGYTTPNHAEAAVKTAMVSSARCCVVLGDAAKFGVTSLVTFARPDDIDLLITDAPSNLENLQTLAKEVVLV